MKKNIKFRIFQPALPAYRTDFFKRVSDLMGDSFEVTYSAGVLGILTDNIASYSWALKVPPIKSLFFGMEWQPGVLFTPINRGDIVVVSGGPRCLTNLLLLIRARLLGAKTIWWGHYWSSTSTRHRFILRMLLMKLSHAVLFYTDQEVLEYKQGFGLRDKRAVSALNNGINVDPIREVREPYVASERQVAAMFIGRLTAKANVAIMLHAMTDPRLRVFALHVVGDGPEHENLRCLALSLGVNDRVIWHGAIIDEEKIGAIANVCRIFVYPGSVGLSLIHAMAYGLPAIVHSTRLFNGPEIAAFTQNVTGIEFEFGDRYSATNAISNIINDFETLDSFSNKSIARVEQSFNTQAMAGRFVELLLKI